MVTGRPRGLDIPVLGNVAHRPHLLSRNFALSPLVSLGGPDLYHRQSAAHAPKTTCSLGSVTGPRRALFASAKAKPVPSNTRSPLVG